MEAKIDPGGPLAPEIDTLFAPRAAQERTICWGDPDLPGPVSKTILGCFEDDIRRGRCFQHDFGCFQEDVACFQDNLGPRFHEKVFVWKGCAF